MKEKPFDLSSLCTIRHTDLTVPGICGNFRFLHVSDTHLCLTDPASAPQENAHMEEREAYWHTGKLDFAKEFGETYSDASAETSTKEAFERLLAFAEAEAVDAVLCTGDLMEGMHRAGENYLRKTLSASAMPFLTVPGNHEDAVCDGLWPQDVQTLDFETFRIVAIDDRLKTFTEQTLGRLEALCRESLPILLMMHVPVVTDGNRHTVFEKIDPYFTIDERNCDENAKRFFSILRNTDRVKIILCGHIHGFSDTEPFCGIRQITASQGMLCHGHLLTVHG